MGFKMRLATDGRVVSARFQFLPEHAGFKGVVHGGVISTVLDEVMAWACAVQTRQFAYCAELTVRFRQPARPGHAVEARGEVKENRRNRIFETHAELRAATGEILAEATGKYLPIPREELGHFAEDFVGDIASFLGLELSRETPPKE
jgi:uncharacterized protein (TIGR00369 family)